MYVSNVFSAEKRYSLGKEFQELISGIVALFLQEMYKDADL